MNVLLRLVVLFVITRLATRSTKPMTDTTTDNGTDDQPVDLGDIVNTSENTVLDPPDNLERIEVMVNMTAAHELSGARCIRLRSTDGDLYITAAQLRDLCRIGAPVAEHVASIRADIGANS